jgi:hypothetical protein
MSELTEILREAYQKKEERKPIDFSTLIEMIEQLYDAIEPEVTAGLMPPSSGYAVVTEESERDVEVAGNEASDEITVIRRPTIKITELWGKMENGDREIMEALMKNIAGDTIEKKVQSVNEFLMKEAPPPGEGDISKIMSYLIFLDTFASIISDYGASVSGFLFEAFLAALFGGTSIQVDDPAQVGARPGSLPIEDVQLALQRGEEATEIVPYSLKVLRKDGVVHGSFKNIVDYFLDPAEERKTDTIVYLIVIKDADKKEGGGYGSWNGKLKFYEFVISRDNFLQLIGAPTEVSIYDYLPITSSRRARQVLEKNPAAIRGWPRYKTLEGGDIPEDTEIPKGTELLRLQDTGQTEKIIKGSAAKLYTPEQYGVVTGKFAEAPALDRQVFAALTDTKGYGSKQKGGAQWSIGHGVYTANEYYKGEIDLDPEVLKTRAEDYTQSLNASIVAIFNALGDLTDNINTYFIGSENQNRKVVGQQAKKDAEVLKREVNTVIKT